jgi:hypothetical protein
LLSILHIRDSPIIARTEILLLGAIILITVATSKHVGVIFDLLLDWLFRMEILTGAIADLPLQNTACELVS